MKCRRREESGRGKRKGVRDVAKVFEACYNMGTEQAIVLTRFPQRLKESKMNHFLYPFLPRSDCREPFLFNKGVAFFAYKGVM